MSDDNDKRSGEFGKVSGMPFDAERVGRNFNRVFGDAMRSFGVISEEQYKQAGDVQAWSIVLAELEDEYGAPVMEAVTAKYGKFFDIPFQNEEPAQILSGLEELTTTIIAENAGADIDAGSEAKKRFKKAQTSIQNAINNEGSVHKKALPIAVVHKGLFLKGKERGMVPNAFFMMQFGLRTLGVVREYEMNPEGSPHVALKVMQQNNKIMPGKTDREKGVFADDEWVQKVHGALRSTASIIMSLNGQNPMPPQRMMMEYDQHLIVAGMEKAAQMFDAADKPQLATMARALREDIAKGYLKYDDAKLANATPEAVEEAERQNGKKDQQNSPYAWMREMNGSRPA
jgi:hypothetical protein